MNRIQEAFRGNEALECVYKDKDSNEFFPDERRAAKNFPAGYVKVLRPGGKEEENSPQKKRGRKKVENENPNQPADTTPKP